MKKVCAAVLVAVLVLAALSITMAAENSMGGSATVGNVAPSVVQVWAPSAANVWIYYTFEVRVQDNNTLANVENIELVLYGPSATQDGADNARNHYTFRYNAPTDTWSEVGPGTGEHLDTTGCSKPADLAVTTDNYKFSVRLAKIAEPGTWRVYFRVVDNEGTSSSDNNTTFTVNQYIEQTLGQSSVSWSSLAPGQENVLADGMPATTTVTSNDTYSIQLKLAGDWTSGSNTFGADNTKFNSVNDVASATAFSTSYQNVYVNQPYGEDVVHNMYFWLSVPNGTPAGTYTNTFYVNATN